MKTWLLVQTDPSFQEAIQTIDLEPMPHVVWLDEAAKAYRLLEANLEFICVVLGAAVEHPLSVAQNLYTIRSDLPIGILCEPAMYLQTLKQLQQMPLIGRYVMCYSHEDSHAVIMNIARMVQELKRHQHYQAQLQAVNQQLSTVTIPVQPDQYLDTLLHHAPMGICLCDHEWHVISWNETAAKMTNQPRYSATPVALPELFPQLDLQKLQQQLQLAESRPLLFSYTLHKELYWFELTGTLVPGTRRVVLVTFSDVTERVEASQAMAHAQARLRFLSELSFLLVQSLDYHETLERLAQAMIPFLADWCVVDVVHADLSLERVAIAADDPQLIANLEILRDCYPLSWESPAPAAQALRNRDMLMIDVPEPARYTLDDQHATLISRLCTEHVLAVPLIFGQRLLGSISLVRTDKHNPYTEDEQQLALEVGQRASFVLENTRLYTEAQNAIMLRDQFLSVAAHELNTPLTALGGSSQLLRRYIEALPDPSERILRRVTIIDGQVKRLDRLITTLLDLSRLEDGRFALILEPTDLAGLITGLVEEIQPILRDHDLQLIGFAEPCVLMLDALRVEQVVQNIINNAIKYSPNHTQVRIQLRRQETDVELLVQDQGMGIPAADLPHIWERFYRAENVKPVKLHGMGIGLSVVRQIMDLHGGSAQIDSVEGQGTTVTLCFPLTTAA